MPSVDNRIVRMEFDNAAFEKKIATTLTSLDKMNKALKFEGASKGLSDISAAAGKVNVGTISEGIEGVSKKFLALSTVALTVLSQITGAALRAGASLAKSLTLDPVMAGFQEYETNMRSIQTVLANTKADGTNLEQVNAALDKLNEYSDKTIYNFSEMARNIGTFTAAGVDLDTSVQSIKGIANLAAVSGSSSEQASTAMYQLSQAISTGTLKLMDWNSVTNAGMGGEVFQKALFESGKALKTIEGVPIDQTFEEWTAGGNSFRSSLEQGWLTADVLTTTLQGFTGEMTEAQLLAKGFTSEQAKNIIELGKTGVEAATKVRTLTQLMSTVKESIASGWSASFRLLVGNFEEATKLFTGLSNTIGGFIQKNADARNKWLETWAKLGGRMLAIEAIRLAFKRLGEILKPLTDAFRKLFPPITAQRIVDIQWAIVNFLNGIAPAEGTISRLGVIFEGFFSLLKIGWTVLKEGVKFIASFVGILASMGGNADVLGFFEKIGTFLSDLAKSLVQGGAITDFFDRLYDSAKKIPAIFKDVTDAIVGFFGGFDPSVPEKLGESVDQVSDKFGRFRDAFGRIGAVWEPFSNAMEKIGEILDAIWDELSAFFSELGDKLSDVMSEGDFDKLLDLINVGLLGGIAIILGKFFKKGIKFDIGGGILEKLNKIFEGLTGTLEAMQTKLKSEALMNIAKAIAILTASVLVLSLIDSEALTKALTAMAVGFGQMMGAFAILTKINMGPSSAASFAILSTGMILLSTAILMLAASAKIFASMSWEELARGLLGVTIMLGALMIAVKPLAANAPQMAGAGGSLLIMAVAMNILAIAVGKMAELSWGEMIRGLSGVIGGMLGLALAMRAMPGDLEKQGLGLLLLSLGLGNIADAVQLFADIPMGDLVKGIISMSAAIAGIGLAMKLMPPDLIFTAAGLLILSFALKGIQMVLQSFGSMKGGDIAKGIAALAGSLLVLGIAMHAMSGAIVGAIALTVMAVGLRILLEVLKGFMSVDFGDLLRGLAGIAIALGILAAAALLIQPAVPAMALLGAALILIGAGFALFGFGAAQVAKAFELFAKVGPKGADAFVKALKAMGKAIPAFVTGLADGLKELVKMIGELAPELAKTIGKILGSLMDTLIPLIPKFGKVIETLLLTLMDILRKVIPEYVLLGVDIILALLQGIRDRIGDIVTVGVEIITEFIKGVTDNIQTIIDAGVDLILAFIQGITDNIFKIAAAATDLIVKFIEEVGINSQKLIDAGIKLLTDFLQGISDNIQKVASAATDVVTEFIETVGEMYLAIIQAGVDLIVDFVQGIADSAQKIIDAAFDSITEFIEEIGRNFGRLIATGVTVLIEFAKGITKDMIRLANAAFDIITEFIKQLRITIDNKGEELRHQGWLLMGAIINGMTGGLAGRFKEEVTDGFLGLVGGLVPLAMQAIDASSPAKAFYPVGEAIAAGIGEPIRKDKSVEAATEELMLGVQRSMIELASNLSSMPEMNPTITPVLDLSLIARDAGHIGDYIDTTGKLVPNVSLQQARTISASTQSVPEESTEVDGPRQVTFEQNIYAPERLTASEIYKQTRNQLAMAKEELSIP